MSESDPLLAMTVEEWRRAATDSRAHTPEAYAALIHGNDPRLSAMGRASRYVFKGLGLRPPRPPLRVVAG
jgi:hypothetical protein